MRCCWVTQLSYGGSPMTLIATMIVRSIPKSSSDANPESKGGKFRSLGLGTPLAGDERRHDPKAAVGGEPDDPMLLGKNLATLI